MDTDTLNRTDEQAELTWDRAMLNLRRLEAACEEAHRLYDDAFMRFREAAPDPATIPEHELPLYCERDRLEADLDDIWQRFLANEGRTWWADDADATKAKKRAVIEAVRAYRQQMAKAKAISNIDALADAADSAADAVADAESVLVLMPAPTPSALRWKLHRLFGPDDSIWNGDYVRQTYADVDKFLGAAL